LLREKKMKGRFEKHRAQGTEHRAQRKKLRAQGTEEKAQGTGYSDRSCRSCKSCRSLPMWRIAYNTSPIIHDTLSCRSLTMRL